MFKNPGGKLQTLAAVIFAIIVVIFCVVGIVLGVAAEKVPFLVVFIPIAGLGVLMGWLNSIMLYAFGSLVEDVEDIKGVLRRALLEDQHRH